MIDAVRANNHPNELWLRWYAEGRRDAARTEQLGSRFRPCSEWLIDCEAWRRGLADAILESVVR